MEEAGRGKGCGLLKVAVARGRSLAVRDFTSSDPYVIVRVADTTAKTKVINSCLNPVWNEEITFSMKEPVGVIKFEVFDWDRFKYDDKMGHAFLDLQPVAAATKLRRALRLTAGETKLRKVAPDVDNCLLSDSFVMYANGEVALDAWLRLRDVESEQVASCSQKKSMPNGHVLIFLCVGDTTFGPVAEGARRQDVRSNEADVKSKRGDGPSRGSSGRKTKTGEDRATQAS